MNQGDAPLRRNGPGYGRCIRLERCKRSDAFSPLQNLNKCDCITPAGSVIPSFNCGGISPDEPFCSNADSRPSCIEAAETIVAGRGKTRANVAPRASHHYVTRTRHNANGVAPGINDEKAPAPVISNN